MIIFIIELFLYSTTSFASLLCELGRQRARENMVRERPPVYSWMMSYEKAVRELPYLGFMFKMPIVVAELVWVGSEERKSYRVLLNDKNIAIPIIPVVWGIKSYLYNISLKLKTLIKICLLTTGGYLYATD